MRCGSGRYDVPLLTEWPRGNSGAGVASLRSRSPLLAVGALISDEHSVQLPRR